MKGNLLADKCLRSFIHSKHSFPLVIGIETLFRYDTQLQRLSVVLVDHFLLKKLSLSNK